MIPFMLKSKSYLDSMSFSQTTFLLTKHLGMGDESYSKYSFEAGEILRGRWAYSEHAGGIIVFFTDDLDSFLIANILGSSTQKMSIGYKYAF